MNTRVFFLKKPFNTEKVILILKLKIGGGNSIKKIVVGYTTGVFDLFHIGHLNLLRKAKSMCDKLIVGVTTDELTEQIKGKMPIIPFNERSDIISCIKFVDVVVSQEKIDEKSDYANYNFDVIFKGDDWKGTERWNELEVYFQKKGARVIFIPYTKETSSSQLKKRIGRIFNE